MESRRLLAARYFRAGATQAQVARKLGVSRTSVSRWSARLNSGPGLASTKASGRPSWMSDAQIEAIKSTVSAPRSDGKRWTAWRVADEIHALTGIRYDEDHVGRLMLKWGLRKLRGSMTVTECAPFSEEDLARLGVVRSSGEPTHVVLISGLPTVSAVR